MKILTPENWKDYELIDCGGFEKLERFGEYFLIRPESQALWSKKLSEKEWTKIAHAHYRRENQQKSYRTNDGVNGSWTFYKKLPEFWTIAHIINDIKFKFKISLTSFGHVGIFPEQAQNWQFIAETLSKFNSKQNSQTPTFLNLFAYTGAASIVAKANNADVTHLDAVKQIVTWAKTNMELSGIDNIRWIVDDAITFLKREVKRGKKYTGIILDPPAYGRGPNGEKWILADSLKELLELTSKLLVEEHNFLIINLYSLGFSSLIVDNLLSSIFKFTKKEIGEFYLHSKTDYKLPLGVFGRIINNI
jgi:23S rRNA (cytosine1962-C5)-methyltransferase